MGIFNWGEIRPTLTDSNSFAQAFSISPNGMYIVGNFGQNVAVLPPSILRVDFHAFRRNYDVDVHQELFQYFDYVTQFDGTVARSAIGVNDDGDVVGLYRDENRGTEIHGYIWRNGARVPRQPFDLAIPQQIFPNADDPAEHSAAFGINNQGLVVGVFQARGVPVIFKDYGYVAQMDDPSAFVRVDVGEGLDQLPNVTGTLVRSINTHGDIVGTFTRVDPTTMSSETHGFKWKVDSDLNLVRDPTIIDVLDPQGMQAPTFVTGINDDGTIVGYYLTFPGGKRTERGFLWRSTGDNYLPADRIPFDLDIVAGTLPQGISNNDIVVGYYRDMGRHAFVAPGLSGTRNS